VALIFCGVWYYKQVKNGLMDNPITMFDGLVKTTPTIKTGNVLPNKVKPKCSSTEINYILKSNDNLLDGKDFLVLDMNTFQHTKTLIKYGKEYKYYQRFGKNDIFVTIAKKATKDISTK